MSSWTSSEVCRSLLPFKALLKMTQEKALVQSQWFLNKTEMRTTGKYLSAYLKSKNNIAAAIYRYKCSASQREHTASGVCLTAPGLPPPFFTSFLKFSHKSTCTVRAQLLVQEHLHIFFFCFLAFLQNKQHQFREIRHVLLMAEVPVYLKQGIT